MNFLGLRREHMASDSFDWIKEMLSPGVGVGSGRVFKKPIKETMRALNLFQTQRA